LSSPAAVFHPFSLDSSGKFRRLSIRSGENILAHARRSGKF